MRIYKEKEEESAVKIIADYLKEEKNIQIKKDRKLTKKEGEPPDCYFEIGDHKIGCEVTHFELIDGGAKKKGINAAKESDIIHDKIPKRVKRGLHEKGIPPLVFSPGFVDPPQEAPQHAETIVNLITMMHNESIADSEEYKRNDDDKYYDCFFDKNIERISFCYRDAPDSADIDEKYIYGGGIPPRCPKTIKVEEMQAVITCKNKDIPNWKKIPNSEECYDQKWLIIANHEFTGTFILKEAAEETEYTCNFDKVFYIEWRGIEPKPRKQKRTGLLTDKYAVYELKTE